MTKLKEYLGDLKGPSENNVLLPLKSYPSGTSYSIEMTLGIFRELVDTGWVRPPQGDIEDAIAWDDNISKIMEFIQQYQIPKYVRTGE